jgi:6-phospho-beta-glucosidase
MKIALLGGGGFRVPMVYGALLKRAGRLGLDEVALYDVSETRLARIAPVLAGLERELGERLVVRSTTVLDEALEGADFVFCAIRPGRLEGRAVDERVPLEAGVVGQETIGPGGICLALRTVPVIVELAEAVAKRAPGAWFINFTNPAGLVTEAIREVIGDRALGICDSPRALCRRVAEALDRSPAELWFDYFGLNHLGWLRGVYDGDSDLLPGLLADVELLESFEEGKLFGADWLRSLGMIPNEYLYFHYFAADTVEALSAGAPSRGEFLLRQQADFYAGANGATPEEALAAWRDARRERDRTYFAEVRAAAGLAAADDSWEDLGGYEAEAIAVVEAIAGNEDRVLILDTANRSSLPFLDESAVVEVPCVVGRAGAIPTAVGDVPAHARALIETIKDVERTTIRAALEGSRSLAVRALALHPLVPSVNVARRIFSEYDERQEAIAGRFS